MTCWGSYAPDEIQEVLQTVDEGDEIFQYAYIKVDNNGAVTANINGVFKA